MSRHLRQYFITGLLVWLPMAVTVWVITWLYGLLDGIFRNVLSASNAVFPGQAQVAQIANAPGLGVLVVVIVILMTGVFVTNIFGQWAVRQWDRLMNRIPVVRGIYTSVKQVSDTLFSGSGNAFSKALLIRYPHNEAWAMAFLTGKPGGEVASKLDGDYVSAFIPTTPNPTSGFFIMLPRSHVIELDMSVDDALKYIISMGVVVPGGPANPALKTRTSN